MLLLLVVIALSFLSLDVNSQFGTSNIVSACGRLPNPSNGRYDCIPNPNECELKCDRFYQLAGDKVRTCSNGQWTEEKAICTDTCKAPKNPDHGNVYCSLDGTTCQFTCNTGFNLDGDARIVCQVIGWSKAEPTCKAYSGCPKLEKPVRGFWECDEYKCVLFCDINDQIDGDGKLVCSNGTWRGKNSTCIASHVHACPKLEKPEHGYWKCDEYKCELLCSMNSQMIGDGKLACSNGAWRGKNSTCIGSDCFAIQKDNRAAKSGRYKILLKKMNKVIEVFCDMETDGGGWTVFQRRTSKGKKDAFYRSWDEYKNGFGDLDDEFWLGNDAIHELTSKSQVLRIDMGSYDSVKKYAKYLLFNVANENKSYKLHIGRYSGDAGDSFALPANYRPFSAKGRAAEGSAKCVEDFKGGWWYGIYGFCHYSNLNGLNLKGPHDSHANGINWNTFNGLHDSLKETTMKMKRLHK